MDIQSKLERLYAEKGKLVTDNEISNAKLSNINERIVKILNQMSMEGPKEDVNKNEKNGDK